MWPNLLTHLHFSVFRKRRSFEKKFLLFYAKKTRNDVTK